MNRNEARQKQLDHLKTVTIKYRGIYEKAYTGKCRPAGVKAKCLDCQNNMRGNVRDCGATSCPLWPYRPYRTAEMKAECLAVAAAKPEAPKAKITNKKLLFARRT